MQHNMLKKISQFIIWILHRYLQSLRGQNRACAYIKSIVCSFSLNLNKTLFRFCCETLIFVIYILILANAWIFHILQLIQFLLSNSTVLWL